MTCLGIKKLREKKNMTQKELADRLGVSRQAICMWEANKRELKATMLNRMAKVLETTVDEIIKPIDTIENLKEEEFEMKKRTNCLMAGKEENMKAKTKEKKVNFEILAPAAKKVSITGSFNAWSASGVSMKRDKNGLWTLEVSLNPGRHEYKFIVDGQWWTDPKNPKTVTNSFGSLNSIKEVAA